jgi:hypothetical protein
MEYPGTHFTRPIRVALLISLIALFLIISPLLIMYTAGYRYDWKNGLLKETGAINIDLEPKNAVVYLNNVKLQDKIPVRLNNIIPAKYNVRVTSPGYFDWNKEIEVKNKQTNYIKEIGLLKKNKPEILITGNITDFAVSYDGQFIIYASKENNGTQIWLWNNDSKQTSDLFRLPGNQKINIVWAEKNNYAIITDSAAPYSQIRIVNALDSLKQIDLTKESSSINKLQWANTTYPQLYYSTKETLFSYSPITQTNQVITANKYTDWYMENGQLWTMRINSSTQDYLITKDTLGFSKDFKQIKNNEIEILTDGDPKEPETKIGFAAAQQNTALLKTNISGRMLLVNNNSMQPMQINNFLISKYNNWWLLWSDWELWSYNDNENPYLLNRSGEHLTDTVPLDQYNTLALVWADKVTALFPYYSVSHDLINEKASNPIADTDNKIFYFIKNNNQDKNSNGIWKLNY